MVASSSRPAIMSRTSSASSVDFTANAFNPSEARRTRKRITPVQLTLLEALYRQSSHPTRDERDALAKRIQMETKSVTIWFQNKRQTDRKVALHNATNSRNLALFAPVAQAPPNITHTTPAFTLPAHDAPRRASSDELPRRQSSMRPASLKRTSSIASTSATSCSTTSTKTSISLDRVASRSEIRFTHREPSTHNSPPFAGKRGTTPTDRGCASAPVTLPGSPTSPPVPPPLWETMLSSPLAPSSPPPAEHIAYARARKIRTLGWACAAARLSPPPSPPWPASAPDSGPTTMTHENATRAREYEEATLMTEDEAELITPQSSQDASLPWSAHPANTVIRKSSPPAEMIDVVMEGRDNADGICVNSHQWDEVHAALALCGLRG